MSPVSREALSIAARIPLPVHPPPAAVDTTEAMAGEIFSFGPTIDREHVAVAFGGWAEQQAPLVRIHSECLTGDVFGSARCDCGPQLREALRIVGRHGGIVLYLRQEGRGIGLYNKLLAYRLQDRGMDTYTANRALKRGEDERDFGVAAQMLHAMGVHRCRLLTNNPDKQAQLSAHGIEVVERVPTGVFVNGSNRSYLEAKVARAHHEIDFRATATEIRSHHHHVGSQGVL